MALGLSRLTPWDVSGRVGLNKLVFPDVQEGLEGARWYESMATAALRGPFKAMRYPNEGAVDKTGVPILPEVGLAGVVGQALSLSPSAVRLATEGKAAVHQLDARAEHRRRAWLLHYSEAALRQDQAGMRDAMAEVRAFNKKQSQYAIAPRQ